MDRSKVTIISIFIAIFLAIIAYLASIIFTAPTSVEDERTPTTDISAVQM